MSFIWKRNGITIMVRGQRSKTKSICQNCCIKFLFQYVRHYYWLVTSTKGISESRETQMHKEGAQSIAYLTMRKMRFTNSIAAVLFRMFCILHNLHLSMLPRSQRLIRKAWNTIGIAANIFWRRADCTRSVCNRPKPSRWFKTIF